MDFDLNSAHGRALFKGYWKDYSYDIESPPGARCKTKVKAKIVDVDFLKKLFKVKLINHPMDRELLVKFEFIESLRNKEIRDKGVNTH